MSRKVYDLNGNDISQGAINWLSGAAAVSMCNLYLFGDINDPNAIKITDYDAPINWPIYGTFLPDTITRGTVSSKVGFEVATLDLQWSPNNFNLSTDQTKTSPYQQAYLGLLDGLDIWSWTCYMTSPGKVYGFSELFGGRFGPMTIEDGMIKVTVNSFLDVVNQQVPGSVIETLNSIAGFKGATPPAGLTQVPTFTVATAGKTTLNAICQSPSAGQIFATHAFSGGFLFFTSGDLEGTFYTIADNYSATIGSPGHTTTVNQFVLFQRLASPPSSSDTFYASATFPINQADGSYWGFPYVPDPNTAL